MRTSRTALLALAFAAAACSASAQSTPANPGFEDGAPALTGWHLRDSSTYAAVLDSVDPHGGRWSARVAGQPGATATTAAILQQRVDPAPYRGRRVRFRAWVRSDLAPGPGWAGLWMRVDRPNGARGFFDNMESRAIRGRTGWTRYEIAGEVAHDAEALFVGLVMVGAAGQAWLDDASLEAGEALPPPEPARPVTERGLENLVAFSRLLGYVRYFHPSDPAAATDWNAFAAAGMRAVEGAPDARRLAAVLDSLFRPIAPALVVRAGDVAQAEVAAPAGDSLRVVWWRHYGVGLGSARGPAYRSDRVYAPAAALPDSAPDPRRPLRVDLGGGVSAAFPLALYVDGTGTLPRAAARPLPAPPAPALSGDDRATRLAAVALGWNVFQHFYPYFDVVPADWPAELPRALRSAAEDRGECAFLGTLRRMVAGLHDGHGSAHHGCEAGMRVAPVLLESVQGRPTVVAVDSGTAGVRLGDVLLRIDGAPADSLVRARGALVSAATPQWRDFVVHEELLAGTDSLVRVTVEHPGGDTATVVLRRVPRGPRPAVVERKPEPVAQLRPGIWYVDLDRVTQAQLQAALPDLERASGIVFDLRGYPDGLNPFMFFSHLLREPGTSAQWIIPVATRPDRADVRWDRREGWPLQPAAPYLAAPRVFITDGRAISFAESVMGIVEAYRLGEIVGGPTAGTNGNVNPLQLPGGYAVGWTGMRVLKHDGSRHHGVGIAPTVPAERTRAGVAAGRDELLERALEVVARAAARP
jgi:C-terminal processing protease CtpA/Prc